MENDEICVVAPNRLVTPLAEFLPLQQHAIPIDEQFKSLEEYISAPYNKRTIDPYTRSRILLLISIENYSMFAKYQMARYIDDDALKKHLSMIRRIESMQLQRLISLIPADESPIETAIGFEQMVVDTTVNLAQNEADDYFKQMLDFTLLEDLDHLYRFSMLYDIMEEGDAEHITRGRTPIIKGRPTALQHRHPMDEMRVHYDLEDTSLRTIMNYLTVVAAEREKMLFYRDAVRLYSEQLIRRIFAEMAEIEGQHLSQYESIGDPHISPMNNLALIELNEAYNYFSALQEETEPLMRKLWGELLCQELGHFQLALVLMERVEGKNATKLLDNVSISSLIEFEPNLEYIEAVLATKIDLQPYDGEFVPEDRLPSDWPSFKFREIINGRGSPSDEVEKRWEHNRSLHSI